MKNVIDTFLAERKTDKLAKKIKTGMEAEQEQALRDDIEAEFSLENWLPDAAKRARHLSIVSHPSKFSHPSTRTSPFVAIGTRQADGFLRTGNLEAELDVQGNAAALDVFAFLLLEDENGVSLLQHIEDRSSQAEQALAIETASFNEIRAGLLAIKNGTNATFTSDKVKQVYFPVGDGYHLLSILTPSGIIFELRKRIQSMRFSETTNEAREARKKNLPHDIGFDDIYGLTVIGYGGARPQNISRLNSKNYGKAYLLPSLPPKLVKISYRPPGRNFFEDTVWPNQFRDSFISLHRLLKADVNTVHIREGRDNILNSIIDQLVERVWQARAHPGGWSANERCDRLPKWQKTLLDQAHEIDRENSEEWFEEFRSDGSRWIIEAYKKVLGKPALALLDDEIKHVKNLFLEARGGL